MYLSRSSYTHTHRYTSLSATHFFFTPTSKNTGSPCQSQDLFGVSSHSGVFPFHSHFILAPERSLSFPSDFAKYFEKPLDVIRHFTNTSWLIDWCSGILIHKHLLGQQPESFVKVYQPFLMIFTCEREKFERVSEKVSCSSALTFRNDNIVTWHFAIWWNVHTICTGVNLLLSLF